MIETFSTDHIDYLQRNGLDLLQLTADPPVTAAPFQLRRLFRINGVGRSQKEVRPAPGQPMRLVSEELLTGLSGNDIPLTFLIAGSPSGVALHFGTWADNETLLNAREEVLQTILKSLYPAIDSRPLEQKELILKALPRAGVAMGIPSPKLPDPEDIAFPLDRLIRSLIGATWIVLVLAEPVSESLVTGQRNQILNEMRAVQGSVQAAKVSSPLAEHYLELLKRSLNGLTMGQAVGAWRTSIYLMGDEPAYQRLASVWRGVFSGEKSLPEPVRVGENPVTGQLAIRWAMSDAPGAPGPGYFHHLHEYQTLLNSTQLATYVHLPHLETNGFSVKTVPVFDVMPIRSNGAHTFSLGEVVHQTLLTGMSYNLDPDDLTRHAFVAGVTGAGKTNTIMAMLKQAHSLGVPFLVIEPAKTEYRALLNDPELKDQVQIFTLGNENVSPFRLNPFEVPSGTPVSVHIDLLRSAFSASFGLWTPLPQILEQCLHQVYADRGWDITTNTNSRLTDGRATPLAFPTLSDLVAKVDEVMEALGYSDKSTDDIRAALRTRINGLRSGGKGRMLDVRQSLPMELLLDRLTILELEGIGDDDDRAFVMGLLFIRLVEYWRGVGDTDSLRHVLVIEEAHRLLTNVSSQGRPEDANPRGKAVEAFANMLAEIRAYGEGIIVADQVPVKLAPDVIKNTNLKIAHRLVDAEDRKVMAGAMAMTELQGISLATLGRGQAAVFAEGEDAPLLIQVHKIKGQAGQTWPDAARVKKHMDESDALALHRELFQAHPGCTDTGPDGGAACQAARAVAEDSLFQQVFAAVILSTALDETALDRKWEDLTALVHARRGVMIDESQMWQCLAWHAAHWLAARRGQQAGWSYLHTGEFESGIQQMLREKLSVSGVRQARAQFRAAVQQLYTQNADPCSFCASIHPEQPAFCYYRAAARDLAASASRRESWETALNSSDRNWQLWEACQRAADEMVETPGDTPDTTLARAVERHHKEAGLCFGQEMLSAHSRRSRSAVKSIMAGLIQEAGLDTTGG